MRMEKVIPDSSAACKERRRGEERGEIEEKKEREREMDIKQWRKKKKEKEKKKGKRKNFFLEFITRIHGSPSFTSVLKQHHPFRPSDTQQIDPKEGRKEGRKDKDNY